MFHPGKFPSYEHATPQAVVSGGLRLCSEIDTAIQQHVEKLANGKCYVVDLFLTDVMKNEKRMSCFCIKSSKLFN